MFVIAALFGEHSVVRSPIFLWTIWGFPRSSAIWNTVIEKVKHRLTDWKRFYLSKGGKTTLIKSTLSNLPTYFISLFLIIASVASQIEKLQSDYLWSGFRDIPKFHLIKWDKVCTHISSSGLGVRNMKTINQALLKKWLWRYNKELEVLWKSVITSKYSGLWGGIVVPMRLEGPMRWVSKSSTSDMDGGTSFATLDLCREMAPRLNFGASVGVVIVPLWTYSLYYSKLHKRKKK